MSATFVSPAQLAEDLGLGEDEWASVTMQSTFPIENRPIVIQKVASVTNKTKEESWPKIVKGLDGILEENPGVRVLVHTVSYKLTKHVYETSRSDRLLTYSNAGERESALAEFLKRDDAVLLAPSFERGVDLPEEDCELIVIAKVPYPYLGDKQINARMYSKGGKVWYAVQTIRSIVQMTGRGMRSKDDWCDTFILDSQFMRLWREHKQLFPEWWRESLVLSSTDPKYAVLREAVEKRKAGRR